MDVPSLIQGGLGIDDRGEVAFVNEFTFERVKRFYIIHNHHPGFVRAWHAHKREEKYVMVVSGAALIGVVKIDNFEIPDKNAKAERFILSAKKPSILYIPSGYANGAMTLTPDAKIIYFSTASMEETRGDDFRYDARYWDIWRVEER